MSAFEGTTDICGDMSKSMTSKQREWLIGLRDVPDFDRTFVPHAATLIVAPCLGLQALQIIIEFVESTNTIALRDV
jgi:hypothetical protein